MVDYIEENKKKDDILTEEAKKDDSLTEEATPMDTKKYPTRLSSEKAKKRIKFVCNTLNSIIHSII